MVVKNRILLARKKEEEIKRRKEEKRRKKVKDSWLAIKGSKKRRLDLASQSCDPILNKKNFFKGMLSNRHTRVFLFSRIPKSGNGEEQDREWRRASCIIIKLRIPTKHEKFFGTDYGGTVRVDLLLSTVKVAQRESVPFFIDSRHPNTSRRDTAT